MFHILKQYLNLAFANTLLKIKLYDTIILFHIPSNNFNMDELKLSDDVLDQIKDFEHSSNCYVELTEEQKLLIDKLIVNEELKEHYKNNGLCEECKQPNTGEYWCHSCNAKRFQQNFKNWTSGNSDVDKLIQESQLGKYFNSIILINI